MLAIWLALAPIAAAEPTFQQLHSDEARATSYLESNWNKYTENYHPNYVLDDNPVTAWVEGVSGQGEGEVLSWDVSALSSARAVRVRIKNGYQKSSGLFAANSAPKEVQLQVWRGNEVVAQQKVMLEKKMGWQEVVLPTNGKGLDHIELTAVGDKLTIEPDRTPISLKGINWHGAESQLDHAPFGLGKHSVSWYGTFLRSHGFNAVRLMFNHAAVLQNQKIGHVADGGDEHIDAERSLLGLTYVEMLLSIATSLSHHGIVVVLVNRRQEQQ